MNSSIVGVINGQLLLLAKRLLPEETPENPRRRKGRHAPASRPSEVPKRPEVAPQPKQAVSHQGQVNDVGKGVLSLLELTKLFQGLGR